MKALTVTERLQQFAKHPDLDWCLERKNSQSIALKATRTSVFMLPG
jgi:hypothetical protein